MGKDEKLELTSDITYDILMGLHRNYRLHKRKLLSSDLKTKEETKCIIFEKSDDLKRFLTAILAGFDGSTVDGIKVYLCAYDEEQTDSKAIDKIPKKPEHVSQLTVGMVATKLVAGKYVDVYTDKALLLTPPQNHGTLCPPDSVCP